MEKFATKIRRASVIKIDEVMIDDMTNYRNQLVSYMLYEPQDKSKKQTIYARIIDELRAVEQWIKKHSQKLN